MTETDNSADILDVRDLIERFEELENTKDTEPDELDEEDFADYEQLKNFLDEMKGYGGDHVWRGDWYPVTLIRDSYFEDYAQELAEDIGAINSDMSWPNNCIDWEQAARELQMDYNAFEYGDVTYWAR